MDFQSTRNKSPKSQILVDKTRNTHLTLKADTHMIRMKKYQLVPIQCKEQTYLIA